MKFTKQYGLMTHVTYMGTEVSIKALQDLMYYFGESGLGIVLPEVGGSRIYGKPDTRVKVTRTHNDRCAVQLSDVAASKQTWEAHIGLFHERFTCSEKSILALVENIDKVDEYILPKKVGKSATIKTDSREKIKITSRS